MAALSDLLPAAAVRLDVRAADWQEAIRTAGGLLVDADATTDAYTVEMLRNVEENGPYLVIAPGFALAHARPSPAVLRTALSWVRLAEPVEFGHESNDPVRLVVALAARDSAAHTDAMAALARLLADPATTRALREAPGPEDLRRILAGDESEPTAPVDAADAGDVTDAGNTAVAGEGERRKRTSGAPVPAAPSTRSSPSAATASAPACSSSTRWSRCSTAGAGPAM
ncbi:PTS sugar transporter subunit IIA [Streptomyces lydicus]|uniref:PTS sugar transporter subunit IIA n=1 Tax=Streptomyces lydicus TaxID=47763 RepID=UPI000B21B60D|nr:PTS sugar transporter subunit IIA [Streptomyces lydicus]MDC7336440.1 PTS sugar transporter subunit IIA [Streptomyces lydicus]UEG94232.1 PTS sugar transporter subunit IIA [Streptomyces lydicus]